LGNEKERHDYSLLGSFMPKDVDPRPSIPVEVDFGSSEKKTEPSPPKDDEKK
jgi:hypothetical protein